MTADSESPVFTVDGSTRVTDGTADYYPRRNIKTKAVHWCYGPTLFRGVEKASPWCTADERTHSPLTPCIPNTMLSTDLAGGVPCPECSARWSMT